ncbi:MAG: hypothetical protein GYA72_08705 [Deltaproteobacteria bacterium]|nr:hypothetical protein [Deltaproteobacteria bacterium]
MNKIVRFIYQYQPTKKNYSETSNKKPVLQNGLFVFGSPCATLFITVLFLPLLTENLQYQRVIKDQAVPARRKRRQCRFPNHAT